MKPHRKGETHIQLNHTPSIVPTALTNLSHQFMTTNSGISVATQAAESPKGRSLFLPISIGNHYYSSRILHRILEECVKVSHSSVIVLCDKLRELVHRGRGRLSEQGIRDRLNKELAELRAALRNAGIEEAEGERLSVVTWCFVEETDSYVEILHHLDRLTERDEETSIFLEKLSREAARRFFSDQEMSANILSIQRHYFLLETALSLTVTECLGHNLECYRRQEKGLVDFLYSSKHSELRKLLGKDTLERQFLALEDFLR